MWVDFSEKFGLIISFVQTLEHWLKKRENGSHAGDKKEANNGTLVRQTLGATDLKLGIHAEFDSGSNMGRVPPGHTSFSHCVMLKMPNLVFWK